MYMSKSPSVLEGVRMRQWSRTIETFGTDNSGTFVWSRLDGPFILFVGGSDEGFIDLIDRILVAQDAAALRISSSSSGSTRILHPRTCSYQDSAIRSSSPRTS